MEVFISYSHLDKSHASRLKADLEAQSINVLIDVDDFGKGNYWDRDAQDMICRANYILVILTQNVNTSQNTLNEVSFANAKNKAIIPLKFGEYDESLLFIRRTYIDFMSDYNEGFEKLLKILRSKTKNEGEDLPPELPESPKQWYKRIIPALIILILVLGLYFIFNNADGCKEPSTKERTNTDTTNKSNPLPKDIDRNRLPKIFYFNSSNIQFLLDGVPIDTIEGNVHTYRLNGEYYVQYYWDDPNDFTRNSAKGISFFDILCKSKTDNFKIAFGRMRLKLYKRDSPQPLKDIIYHDSSFHRFNGQDLIVKLAIQFQENVEILEHNQIGRGDWRDFNLPQYSEKKANIKFKLNKDNPLRVEIE